MKAVNIKTEYLKNPLGIDIENPRVMWNCEGGVTQNAYQIVTDDWDSGKIESSSMRIVVPVKFEKVSWNNFDFIVQDMEGHRINLVKIIDNENSERE